MSQPRGPSTPAGAPVPVDRGSRVVAFGEVLFDHFPDGRRVLGGAPFNVAWHLCGFGGDPLLLSVVGDDDPGREVLDQMDAWGLSTGGVSVDRDRATGQAVAHRDGDELRFEVPPDQAWDHLDPDLLPERLPSRGAGLVYHGTLPLRSEVSWSGLRKVLDELDAPSFIDLNLTSDWWTREHLDWCLERATWVKCSVRELEALTGEDCSSGDSCLQAAIRLRRERGIPMLVVTRSTEGSLLVTHEDEVLRAEAPAVADLVDTVGAGDAFAAVLCHGILQGWEPRQSLQRASDFAAEACRFEGATATDLSVYESHLRRWAHVPRSRGVEPPVSRRLYVLSLSVHGLLRGQDIELGRDADTGGQVSYVVDQARALADHPGVDRVDVVTRQVHDRKVDASYAEPTEDLGAGARIVRLPFGPRRYLRKESLWPYLDSLLDQLIRHVRAEGRIPDVVHSHYADAGYVGAQLSKLLGVPFVFTGHSLGRVKHDRLIADGADPATLEERYHFARRFEAEEQALETASLVIASTRQEVSEQYEGYDHYAPGRMEIIPPGVDLTRFSPPSRFWTAPPIAADVGRFLNDPDKPMILALARADDRKNFQGLLRAFAETPGLRDAANLVIVAGNRDDIREMDPSTRRVLTEILLLIDRYDLYGSVAYPKHHGSDDVPDLYRMAAHSRGLFVNPALTEPFGLTLIEAAASGLPVVATNDGGPRDILEECGHGVLADPLDTEAMGKAILDALTDRSRWARWAKSGVARVHERFSWKSHAGRYVEQVDRLLVGRPPAPAVHTLAGRLPRMDRILVTDVDNTLTGDDEALAALTRRLHDVGGRVGFGLATGRPVERAMELVEQLDGPDPDVFIAASGTELHYGTRLIRDRSWERQIRYRWRPEEVERALEDFPGVSLREEWTRTEYRLRYQVNPDAGVTLAAVRSRLRQHGVQATPILDHSLFLDVIPIRASPGLAIRFFCFKWNLAPERLLVAGDSGNDVDMLSGDTLGVVVGNHTDELESLRGRPRIYFAEGRHAWGVIEGIEHYRFFDEIRVPEEEFE